MGNIYLASRPAVDEVTDFGHLVLLLELDDGRAFYYEGQGAFFGIGDLYAKDSAITDSANGFESLNALMA